MSYEGIFRALLNARRSSSYVDTISDLDNVNLTGLDLSNLNLENSTFEDSTFKSCNLTNTNFSGSFFMSGRTLCSFENAVLNNTDFSNCELQDVFFSEDANIESCNFQDAIFVVYSLPISENILRKLRSKGCKIDGVSELSEDEDDDNVSYDSEKEEVKKIRLRNVRRRTRREDGNIILRRKMY